LACGRWKRMGPGTIGIWCPQQRGTRSRETRALPEPAASAPDIGVTGEPNTWAPSPRQEAGATRERRQPQHLRCAPFLPSGTAPCTARGMSAAPTVTSHSRSRSSASLSSQQHHALMAARSTACARGNTACACPPQRIAAGPCDLHTSHASFLPQCDARSE